MNKKMRIMIVDDEMIIRESFFHWFVKAGHDVETAASAFEALEKLEKTIFDVMFVDIKMPGMSGMELLNQVKEAYPDTAVVIITAFGTIDTAIQAMKTGAVDYLLKPFKPEQLNLVLEKIIRQRKITEDYNYLKQRLSRITKFENIIGGSPAMSEIFELITEVAASDASVLILGETGTGKELVAKAIHAKSPRNQGPFIAINCGAIPITLMESELFGHQKGAFTGASQARKGFLEIAFGGTLFLDEIGEISPKMQVDLLRVLEEKKMTRIGSCCPIDVDFRLISATRREPEKMIGDQSFRSDFFYRINVITIAIPPLRQRKGDIPLLVDHFVKKFSQETNKPVDTVHREALSILNAYDWPGNVRELENAIERAVVLAKSRTLGPESFYFLKTYAHRSSHQLSLLENEKAYICQILEDTGWNITRAAQVLDINRVTLHKKINRYHLKRVES